MKFVCEERSCFSEKLRKVFWKDLKNKLFLKIPLLLGMVEMHQYKQRGWGGG